MAKADVLDILRSRKMDPLEFHFENLWIPPIYCYLTQQDIDELRNIATSARLASKIRQKYDMIDAIMTKRGFKRFSAGTNRVVYRFIDDARFLVKIAVDKVGMQDNPLEYKNQFLLQPFVTKMFYVSSCGTVGFSERVLPIKNRAEFKEIASDVFDILVNKILGLYVVEDVGNKYFMNWGIRQGFGPVLLDYPYVYKLDGDKLFCNWINPDNGSICDGEIDYDVGFNHLVCSRCGKVYLAANLRDDTADNNLIIRKGGNEMRIIVRKGDEIIASPIPTDEVMKPTPKFKTPVGFKPPVVKVITPSGVIDCNNIDNKKINIIPSVVENKIDKNVEGVKPIIDNKEEEIHSETSEEIETKNNETEPKNDQIDLPIITSSFIKPDSNTVEEDNNVTNTESSDDSEIEDDEDMEEDEEDESDDDQPEDVFVSDEEVKRRNEIARMERNNSVIISGNNDFKSGKKNKKHKKNKKNYIPNTETYRRG